ncbi:MAG TPA: caspase family protein [Vicinamibacterales bacterium]|nr:caspase family protein [Vicinamibacterales bacterium]
MTSRWRHAHRSLLACIAAVALALPLASVTSGQQSSSPDIVLQVPHLGRVNDIAVSRDGRRVVTVGSDRTVKIWDAARGLIVRTLDPHGGEVHSVSFSPDGLRIITASHEAVARIWDLETGAVVSTLTLDRPGSFVGAGFSADGAQAITSSRQTEDDAGRNEIIVWNLRTSRPVRRVETNGWCKPLVLSPDASLAFCGSGYGELWDVATLKRLAPLPDGSRELGRAEDASFNPSGTLLAMVSFYGLDVWDVQRFERVHRIRDLYVDAIRMSLARVAFSPDGRTIAAGDESGQVGRWDAVTGKSIDVERGTDRRAITALAFTSDGQSVISATEKEPVAGMARWTVNNSVLKFAGSFYSPRTADAAGNSSSRTGSGAVPPTSPEIFPVTAVRFSPDGRLLVAGSQDGKLRLWNLQNGRLSSTMPHPGEVRDIAFPRNGTSFATVGGGGGVLRLWDVMSDEPVRAFSGSVLLRRVAFYPDGRTLITGERLENWDVSRDEAVRRYPLACDFRALSPDGRLIACQLFRDEGTIRLLDASSGKEVRDLRGHRAEIAGAAFTPDGARLVSASADGTLRVWDVGTGRTVATLRGHEGPVRTVAVDRSGTRIASGGADARVHVWDVRGQLLHTFTGHTNAITSVSFGPEDMTIASGSEDGSVRIWSPARGTHLATLLATEDEWLAVSPTGHYNGSSGVGRYVAWRIGTTIYDFDQFFERFYTPDLLVRMFQGASLPAAARTGTTPPSAVILTPRPGQTFREPDVDVEVEVRDAGDGVGDVRVSLNGKQLDSSAVTRGITATAPGASILRYRVSLLDGANVLRATAFATDRTESAPHELTVRLEAPVKTATLRLLAVGISRYQNPGLSLTFPSADARDLIAFFRTRGPRLFKDVDVTELADTAATAENVKRAIVEVQRRALPEDVVIVFLAGHGASIGNEWYFVPHDLRNPEREEQLASLGVSSTYLAQELRRMTSQKVLLLVDACYSGSMLSAFRGYEDRRALALLARSAGVHILAASTRDQRASEVPELGHGVFSYALLRGLEGAAALRDVDNQVTAMSLASYVRTQLPDLGRQYRAEVQDPVVFSNGTDFPLVLSR